MAAAPKKIKVRFATNRNHLGGAKFGTLIADPNDPSKYRTGVVDMVNDRPELPDSGWNMVPSSFVLDPEGEGDAPELSARAAAPEPPNKKLGILAFKSDVDKAAASSFGIVLLPGFAATFLDSLRRAAQIGAAYGASKVFVFSWPANGRIAIDDYGDDQRDAERSAKTIALSLVRLFKEAQDAGEGIPRIELVAHSMGCLALRHAIQAIKDVEKKLVAKAVFEGALLMAADEDFDSLSDDKRLKPLLKLAKRVTVYTADSDLALALAATLNGIARLGVWGPKDHGTLPKAVTRVDVSSHSWTGGDVGESHHNHQYYRISKAVIADVRQVVAGTAPNKIQPRNPHPTGGLNGRAWKVPFYNA
jgi:esterase/lipase superfamily enzyme